MLSAVRQCVSRSGAGVLIVLVSRMVTGGISIVPILPTMMGYRMMNISECVDHSKEMADTLARVLVEFEIARKLIEKHKPQSTVDRFLYDELEPLRAKLDKYFGEYFRTIGET